jgi:hypothetical protein
MIEEIARDLKIAVSDDGLIAAPPGRRRMSWCWRTSPMKWIS